MTRLYAAILVLLIPAATVAEWSGNMAINPSFEEDFCNPKGEGDVLSFKGDWYYNQRDGVPDYWALKGGSEWRSDGPHGGSMYLRLAGGATAGRAFNVAYTEAGGGAWGGAQRKVPTCHRPEQFPRSVRASVWCRGGGTLELTYAGAKKSAQGGGGGWTQISVEIAAAEQKPGAHNSMSITLTGPGDFDDVVVQEDLDGSPNLLPNSGIEDLDKGFPAGWSKQKKYTWMGPTYYIWTDWYHFHQANRGEVAVDTLVAHSGRNSLRFDVMPGDEKMVEGPEVVLNQDAPRLIEVGAMVRADRIMLIDLRAVNEDGVDLPCARPRQPEVKATPGARIANPSALYGNGTFGWRYIRKVFAPVHNRPLKSVRVRLCARGLNGCTLDDGGTRHYCRQSGTVWWDDVRLVERASSEAQLKARRVKVPKSSAPRPAVRLAEIDWGERLIGPDAVKLKVEGGQGVSFRLTQTLPDGLKKTSTAKADGKGNVSLPYQNDSVVHEFDKPGFLEVTALRGNGDVGSTKISYYTWPVTADFDFDRHYNYPGENPVICTINLGVTKALIGRTARVELSLTRAADGKVLAKQTVANLSAVLGSKAALESSYPVWVADQTNLIVVKLDLGRLKVWPQDEPTRDTYVHLRALDAGGKLVFETKSQRIGRLKPFDHKRTKLIKTVEVRKEDGAVLVNGEPVFLTGGTHQNARLAHGPKELALYGFRGHRLTGGGGADGGHDTFWGAHRLWQLQTKPVAGAGTTVIHTELTDAQFAELQKLVDAGKHLNVISYNTGGWEAVLRDKSKWKAHYKSNDRVRKMTGRLIAISTSGAYNAWEFDTENPWYDINHAETEMWGPMDFNVIYTPYMKRRAPKGRRSTWVYLPQLYDNHPFERLRFETYENIIRGSCGYSMIQGIGDPTFNRGMCGELRYLEGPLYSLEKAPDVTLSPNISHKVTRYKNKLYVLATNAGPISTGEWRWHTEEKHSGRTSHDGDSLNAAWRNPNGWSLHGYRGDPCGGSAPALKRGDKIVQYVWIDPDKKPECVVFGIRGDGKFAHNVALGKFSFQDFVRDASNVFFYTELNHSTWHHVNWYFDEAKLKRARQIMGGAYADSVAASSKKQHDWVTQHIYKSNHFRSLGSLPPAGKWHRIEVDAEKAGMVGKLMDGCFYAVKGGRALWDYTVLVRDGTETVLSEDAMGIAPDALSEVTISVPGVPDGTPVKVLFEERTLSVTDGKFTDSFVGEDAYGREAYGIVGDNLAFMPQRPNHDFRELVTIMPSGHGYIYNGGKTCARIYEIQVR